VNKKYSYIDICQSDQWFRFFGYMGWERVVFDTNLSARILKTILGSFIVIEKSKNINDKMLGKIEKFAKDNKAIYLQIKPGISQKCDSLEKNKYDFVKKPVGITKTGIIDLNFPLDVIYKNVSKSERNLIKVFQNKTRINITSEYSNDEIDEFYDTYRQIGLSKKFITYPKKMFYCFMKSFKNNSYLCTVKNANNEYLGGCIFVFEGKTAWYMFAAMNKKGRKLAAGYIMLWKGIDFLKNKGFEFLDLEGLYDERYPKAYKYHRGYSSFKERFHPNIVYYPKIRVKYYSQLYKTIEWIL